MTRLVLSTVVVLTALNLLAATHDRNIANASLRLSWRQAEIIKVRHNVHACQHRLGLHRSRVAHRVVAGGPAYRAWVLRLWRDRLGICRALERKMSDPVQAILAVFGRYGWQAVNVAKCETGGTFNVYARNGQYVGLFQVSDHWRRTVPGFGFTPLAQARHAYRVFRATGYSWSHWTCRP